MSALETGDKVRITLEGVVGETSFGTKHIRFSPAGNMTLFEDIVKEVGGTIQVIKPTTGELIRALEPGDIFTVDTFTHWTYVRQAGENMAYIPHAGRARVQPITEGGWDETHYGITVIA